MLNKVQKVCEASVLKTEVQKSLNGLLKGWVGHEMKNLWLPCYEEYGTQYKVSTFFFENNILQTVLEAA